MFNDSWPNNELYYDFQDATLSLISSLLISSSISFLIAVNWDAEVYGWSWIEKKIKSSVLDMLNLKYLKDIHVKSWVGS